MKYSLLILSFAFVCALLPAAEPVKNAAADQKAAQEAKAKAEKEAAKKAREAEKAKQKAEAAARAKQKALERENRKAYDNAYREFIEAFLVNDEAICKAIDKAIDCMGRPGAPAFDGKNPFAEKLRWSMRYNRENCYATKKSVAYSIRQILAKCPDCDGKPVYMRAMADYMVETKTGTPEEIAKLRADGYKVPGLSKSKLFELYTEDNELKKADAMAEELFKDTPADKKTAMLNRIIAAFQAKRVFGSAYAEKWLKKKIELTSGNAKADAIGEYAEFMDFYALASLEDVEKLRESRFNVPDITPAYKASLLREKIAGTPAEKDAAMAKLMEFCAKDDSLRNDQYWKLGRSGAYDRFKLFRDYAAKDPYTYSNPKTLTSLFDLCYGVGCTDGHYAESEAILQDALKKVSGKAEMEMAVRNSMASFYTKRARRLYDTQNPGMLKKAIAQYEIIIKMIPDDKAAQRIPYYSKIAGLALTAGEYELVRKQAKLLADAIPDDKKATDKNWLSFQKTLAHVAYKEGNYAEAVKLMEPFMAGRIAFADVELMVRSLNALKEYDKAYSYKDQMLRLSSSFMRPRYTTMFEEMKKRTTAK